VLVGVMEVLGIKESLRVSFLEKGVQLTKEQVDKMVQPIVVSGVPALAREQDSQRLITGISQIISVFGPSALPLFNQSAVAKEFLDGLRINTEGLLAEQQIPPEILAQLPPEIQSLPTEQIMQYLQQANQ